MATVLLIDDDDAVRGLVDGWLSESGFDVIAASDGNLGLRQLEARPEIDLCISDLVMPDAIPDGAALFYSIRTIRPDLPVILMTGYYSAGARIGDTKVALLYKPVSSDDLLAEIDRLLVT